MTKTCRLCGGPVSGQPEKTLPHANSKDKDDALCSLLVALLISRGNKSHAAKLLGAHPATVFRQLAKLKGPK
jgi:transcriptional regulator of acetoin/glycerol metabolism